MKHLDLDTNSCIYNYWRLTIDSNYLLTGIEHLVLMGLEPIRGNCRNNLSIMIK